MATRAHRHPETNGHDRGAGLRYTDVAIVLHWLIALAIFYNLASGLLRPVLPRGFFVFHISSGITILALSVVRVVWRITHKPPPFLPMKRWESRLAHTVHILLYAAILLMPFSGWALVSANPPIGSPGAEFAAAERAKEQAARGGPAMGQAPPATAGPGRPGAMGPQGGGPPRRGPTMVWGLFRLPLIAPVTELGRTVQGVPRQRALHERIETFHLLGGWVMLALLILHIGGALKHQFIDRERELARMGIGKA